jgi:transposase
VAAHSEVAEHTRAITSLVQAWHPELLTRTGVGPIVAAIVLCAWSHPAAAAATRAYAQRRRAQGKTNREIKRCLVRYVARQLFRLLERQAGSRFVV